MAYPYTRPSDEEALKMATDVGILRTEVHDGEDFTPEAEHTAGLEVAQPLLTVLRGGMVIRNGHHFCRAW